MSLTVERAPVVRRRRELVMVAWPKTPARSLPLLNLPPLSEPPLLEGHRSRVTMPGYRKGCKPGNAGRKWPAEILTTSEMLRLLAATGKGYVGARDRALYTVLWRCGVRISEALDLLPKDIDFESGMMTVLHGKNDKRRVVGVDAITLEELVLWMAKRAELGVGRDQPVFCVVCKPNVGNPLYSACVRAQLKGCAKRAGIEKRVHPHGLRHMLSVELSREGVPIRVIGAILGHSNPATTARYINHLAGDEAAKTMRARIQRVEGNGQ